MTQTPKTKSPSHAAHDQFAGPERWRRYRPALIGGAVALLVVAVIYAWASHVREVADARGLRELFKTHQAVQRGVTPVADRAAAYAKVAADHTDSDATVSQALLFEFAAHREAGNAAAAVQAARGFLARFPRHAMAPDTRLALVKLLAIPTQVAEAREEFAKLQRNLPAELAPDVALLQGQIERAAADAATNPDERRRCLEAARDAFQKAVDQIRSRGWAGKYLVMAQFELSMIQDTLAGHTPAAPTEASASLPFPEAVPPAAVPTEAAPAADTATPTAEAEAAAPAAPAEAAAPTLPEPVAPAEAAPVATPLSADAP